jgi:tellurite resistance protein TerC
MPAAGVGTPALWVGFTAFVVVMLALDLGVFHRTAHVVRLREAAIWSAFWIALAMGFAGVVYWRFGSRVALEYVTGYLIEKALSVDNIFVILVILSYFGVPRSLHHRVLFWGILGALVMRGAFIFLGAAFLKRFHFAMYVFGAFLVLTALKLFRNRDETVDPGKSRVVRLFRRFVPSVPDFRGAKFFVRENGRLRATPLLLVLVTIEATDLVFAVDSIPAIFAITRDEFIVYTSNIFAILGLRSLFFLLAGVIDRFHYLKLGLAAVLLFVGCKMLAADLYKLPIGISLAVVGGLLGASIAASLLWPAPEPFPSARPDPGGRGA